MIRFFDIIFSVLGLIILLPLMIIFAVFIILDSRGGILYKQIRIGKKGIPFHFYKFRTMKVNSDKGSLITIGSNDSRITNVGGFLRKYKLDELPQLFNVVKGNMSIVGPRPEVQKYVDLYNNEQKKILEIKPGITDYASIEYRNENDILAASDNPEDTYIKEVMPRKIELNMKYINKRTLLQYFKIIILTIIKIF